MSAVETTTSIAPVRAIAVSFSSVFGISNTCKERPAHRQRNRESGSSKPMSGLIVTFR